MTKSSIEEPFDCPKCGRRKSGFARCQTPGCGELRNEFRGRERVVVGEIGPCVLSGARTDVRLPNGDYLWASYFLEFLQAGWLDESYSYTDGYYATHPHRRRRRGLTKSLVVPREARDIGKGVTPLETRH